MREKKDFYIFVPSDRPECVLYSMQINDYTISYCMVISIVTVAV